MSPKSAVLRICLSALITACLISRAGAFIDTRRLKLKEIPQGPIVAFANAPSNAYQETGLLYRTTINKDTLLYFLKMGKRAGVDVDFDPQEEMNVMQTAGVFFQTNGQAFFWRLRKRTLTIENTNCELATLVLDDRELDKLNMLRGSNTNKPKTAFDTPLRPADILYFSRGPCAPIRLRSDRLQRGEFDRFLTLATVDKTLSKDDLRQRLNGNPPLDFGILLKKDFQILYWISWRKDILELKTELGESVLLSK